MTARVPNSTHPGRDVRMDQLAEWMSENGGRIRDAAKALDWPYENTKAVWRRVCKRTFGERAI